MDHIDIKELKSLIARHKLLYHYTNFESALKIITKKTLLLNPLAKMNDFNENNKVFYSRYTASVFDNKMYKELNQYQVLSTCIDVKDSDGYIMGFNISSMWAHYAQNNKGCCLMINKISFLEENKNKITHHNKVKYDKHNNQRLDCMDCDSLYGGISQFIENKVNEIFFSKTVDWEQEQEYRIVCKTVSGSDLREELSISNSLAGVIVLAGNTDENTIIKKICDNCPFLELDNTLTESRLTAGNKHIYP